MFNIGVGELLVVLVVAFVIVGPDDLPRVARWLGRQYRKLKRLIRDVKAETGWDELEKEVSDVRREVKRTVRDMDVTRELRDAAKDVKSEIEGVSKDVDRDVRQFDQDLKRDLRAADDGIKAAVGEAGNTADTAKEAARSAAEEVTRAADTAADDQ